MADFRGQKIESQDAEALREKLDAAAQHICAGGNEQEKWAYFLSHADGVDLSNAGQALLKLTSAQQESGLKLLKQFSFSEDWNIRDSVARLLSPIQDEEVEEILKRLILDENSFVRYAAFKSLCHRNYAFADSEKINLLNDTSEMVSEQAKLFFI